jgi:hypothetical protein
MKKITGLYINQYFLVEGISFVPSQGTLSMSGDFSGCHD